MKRNKINWSVLLVSLVIVFVFAAAGSLFTARNVNDGWYAAVKPVIAPPNWIFGPVWTALYILIGLSIYFAWIKSNSHQKYWLVGLFGINLVLNASWSYFFFGKHEILLAFYVLMGIWLSIIALLVYTFRICKSSFYSIIPYFLWVSFAGILNYLSYLKSVSV